MKLTKKIVAIVLSTIMAVSMLPVMPVTALADTASDAATAMSAFENMLANSNYYTNMSAAYTAYVNLNKKQTDDNVAALNAAVANMSVWTPYTGTAKGSFVNDDSYVSDSDYANTYKNLLYAQKSVSSSAITTDYHVWNSASNYRPKSKVSIFYGDTTMLYDGTSSTLPQTGVLFQLHDAAWDKGSGNQNNFRVFYCTGDTELGFLGSKWHGTDTNNKNFQWTYYANGEKNCYTTVQTSSYENGVNGKYFANYYQYKAGDFDSVMKTVTPTFTVGAGNDKGNNSFQFQSAKPIRIFNYKLVKDTMAANKFKLADVSNYKRGELKDIIAGYDNAMKNPNSFFTSSNDYENCEANYELAINQMTSDPLSVEDAETPITDQESNGDAISSSGVIYTHKAGDIYSKYGQQISNDASYRLVEGHRGERCTFIYSKYPNEISTTAQDAIYCLSDEDFVAAGYSEGNYRAEDVYGNWVDGQGNVVADPATAAANGQTVQKVYRIIGSVSNYFHYHEDGDDVDDGNDSELTKKLSKNHYAETGVQLIITYVDTTTGKSYGEYEFMYVEPNPAMAHTIVGLRDQRNWQVGQKERRDGLIYFTSALNSYGKATTVQTPTHDSLGSYSTSDTHTVNNGSGVFNFLDTFGVSQASIDADYTSPEKMANHFTFFPTESVGVNAGVYSIDEYKSIADKNNLHSYKNSANVVDADYYVDYSDTELYDYDGNGDNLIVVGNDGIKPVGFTFQIVASNMTWASYNTDMQPTSADKNKTGLNVSYYGTHKNSSYATTTNHALGDSKGVKILNYYSNGTNGFDTTEYMQTSGKFNATFGNVNGEDRGVLNQTNGNSSNGSTNNKNGAWTGTITFSGRESVKKSTDTSLGAFDYANYILEIGTNGWDGGYYLPKETYHYYNIGVSTCDKGAVREFLDNYANRNINILNNNGEKWDPKSGDRIGPMTPATNLEAGVVSQDDIDNGVVSQDVADSTSIYSGKYTVSSYREYLDALAEAYYFLNNPENTTYIDENGVEREYSTAYGTTPGGEHSMIYADDTGADIFGNAGAHTDPVQAQIILNIIDAYEHLFTVKDYEEAEEVYEESKEKVQELILNASGNYTTTSVNAWQNFAENIKDYYEYYTDKSNPVDEQEYWRYVELTGTEYEELSDAVKTMEKTLMPVLDTDELKDNIVTQKAVADDGVMGAGGQQYSYGSWDALVTEIEKSEDLVNQENIAYVYDGKEIATDANGDKVVAQDGKGYIQGMYEVTGTGEYKYGDQTITYQTFDKTKLSEVQQAIYDEDGSTGILMSKELVEVDDDEAYLAFDAIDATKDYIDYNKYVPEKKGEIVNTLANAHNSVYATFDADQVARYNAFVGENAIDTDTVLRRTGKTETDPITAELLSYHTKINDTQKDTYVKQFTAKLKDGDTQTKYYGETFTFDEPAHADNQYVKWSVSNYAYGVNIEGDLTDVDPESSSKVVSNGGISRIANANIFVTAKVTDAETTGSTMVKIYNAFDKVVKIDYIDGTVYDTTSLVPDSIPFYTWKTGEWEQKLDSEGVLHVKPVFVTGDAYSITVNNTSETYKYNESVTVTSDDADFYAWASKANGKYSVASYNKTYSFFVVGNEEFVPITKTAGKYYIDGTEISADDFVIDAKFGKTAQEYLISKLDQKAPFISIVASRLNTADSKYYAYCRVTEKYSGGPAQNYDSCSITMTRSDSASMTGNVTNILQNGQFYVVTKSNVTFKANVNYEYLVDFEHTNNEDVNDVSSGISTVDSSNVM